MPSSFSILPSFLALAPDLIPLHSKEARYHEHEDPSPTSSSSAHRRSSSSNSSSPSSDLLPANPASSHSLRTTEHVLEGTSWKSCHVHVRCGKEVLLEKTVKVNPLRGSACVCLPIFVLFYPPICGASPTTTSPDLFSVPASAPASSRPSTLPSSSTRTATSLFPTASSTRASTAPKSCTSAPLAAMRLGWRTWSRRMRGCWRFRSRSL